MLLFHPKKNLGRKVTINGKEHTIISVTKDKKAFRVEAEKFGVVHDYTAPYIEEAPSLSVSVNEGETWIDIPFLKDSVL